MQHHPLRQIWARGDAVLSGWLSIPSSITGEQLGHAGYDAVTLDLQHGMFSFEQTLGIFQALASTPALTMARVSANDPVVLGRVLDAGALGVICPLINSAEEARAFVSACRYHPGGTRSYAPGRGQIVWGPDYFARANDQIVKLAMVETAAGIEAVDGILQVEGLDGIFIGPNDLAISLGQAPASEPTDAHVRSVIEGIGARARAAGKVAGILTSGPQAALQRIAEGFNFVTTGGDLSLLMQAARQSVATVREGLRGR